MKTAHNNGRTLYHLQVKEVSVPKNYDIRSSSNAIDLNQFSNRASCNEHRETTAFSSIQPRAIL